MALETEPFDSAEFLDAPEARAAYLAEMTADGDPRAIVHAIGTLVRAQGRRGRDHLHEALAEDGDPRFATVARVLETLGLRLAVVPAMSPAETRPE